MIILKTNKNTPACGHPYGRGEIVKCRNVGAKT